MNTIRGILGAIFLFFGRDLNFLFAGGMAALIAQRVLPNLPPTWPGWADLAFIIGMGIIAAALTVTHERSGYALSGFLGGAYFLADYYVPNFTSIPWLPFIVGGVIGGVLLGIFTEWALMIVSSLVGAFFVVDLFRLSPEVKIMISGGLFLAGALTQVIIRRLQQK